MVPPTTIFLVIGLIVALLVFFVIVSFFSVWIQALFSNAYVPFRDLIGMRLRHVPARLMVEARIQMVKAGMDMSTNELEAHFLSAVTSSMSSRPSSPPIRQVLRYLSRKLQRLTSPDATSSTR